MHKSGKSIVLLRKNLKGLLNLPKKTRPSHKHKYLRFVRLKSSGGEMITKGEPCGADAPLGWERATYSRPPGSAFRAVKTSRLWLRLEWGVKMSG